MFCIHMVLLLECSNNRNRGNTDNSHTLNFSLITFHLNWQSISIDIKIGKDWDWRWCKER